MRKQQTLQGGRPKKGRYWQANESQTPQGSADTFLGQLCQRYDLSKLSLLDALREPVLASLPGFSIDDVAADCLHPHTGRRGNGMVSDLFVHWLWSAVVRVRLAPRELPLLQSIRNTSTHPSLETTADNDLP